MDVQSTVTHIVTKTAGQSHRHIRPTATVSFSKSTSLPASTSSSSLISSTTSIASTATPNTHSNIHSCNGSKFYCTHYLLVIVLFCLAIGFALVGPFIFRIILDRIKAGQSSSGSAGKRSFKGNKEWEQYNGDRGYPAAKVRRSAFDQSHLEAGPPGSARSYDDHDEYAGHDDYGDKKYTGDYDDYSEEGDMGSGHAVHMDGFSAPSPGAPSPGEPPLSPTDDEEEYD